MGNIINLSERYSDVNLPDGIEKQYKLEHYIDDPDLYKAVMFAFKLIDEDRKTIDEAVKISGKYYQKDVTDIRLNLPYEICESASAEDGRNYRLYVDMSLERCMKPVAVILSDHNMCCCENNEPYILTKCRFINGTEIYSCQCACGGWCTNGHDDPIDAVKEYESMCESYIKQHRKEQR